MLEPGNTEQETAQDVLRHVPALDGVRGLAISLVLVHHLLWSSPETGSRVLNVVVKLREAGWVGVDLFFALSGFLITGILFDSLQDAHYFKNFYVRRVLRIFPLYYAVMLLFWVFFHNSLAGALRPLVDLATYTQNLAPWHYHAASARLVLVSGHLWSLAVEEQFYLVWPVLIFLVKDRRKLTWLAAGIALAAFASRILVLRHGAPLEAAYKLTFCRADSLLAGGWLALMMRGPGAPRVKRFAAPVFVAALAGCLLVAWRSRGFDWAHSREVVIYGFSLLGIAWAALIAVALEPRTLTARLCSGSLLRFMGRYSYGIYVYHQIIGISAAALLMQWLRDHMASRTLLHGTLLALDLGITIPLAVLSFHFFEQPFLRLKRFFNYQHSRSSALES